MRYRRLTDQEFWSALATIVAIGFAICALAYLYCGCAAHEPPKLYPAPLLDMDAPELPAIEPLDGECPEYAAFIQGEPPPFSHEGLATCTGTLGPTWKVLTLKRDAKAGEYWHERASICQEYRSRDREAAQRAFDQEWEWGRQQASDAARLRAAAPFIFVGGVVVGIVAGVTAGTVAGVTLP